MASVLARTYSARGDEVMTAGRSRLDIADAAAVRSAILDFKPDIVINAAAYTAVDRAEDEPEQAHLINCEGAGNAAAGARAAGAPLIHISTDYVFDGMNLSPYVETDDTSPLGVYGQSKLAGEKAVAASGGDYVILRTSWLCGETGGNFVKTMLRLAQERKEISVVDDQWGTPTFASDLAGGIGTVGDAMLGTMHRAPLCGLYHAAGSSATSWYLFARGIMKSSATKGGASCAVKAITMSERPTRARRPKNSRLDSSKLAEVFGVRLPSWQDSLERCLDRLLSSRGAEP